MQPFSLATTEFPALGEQLVRQVQIVPFIGNLGQPFQGQAHEERLSGSGRGGELMLEELLFRVFPVCQHLTVALGSLMHCSPPNSNLSQQERCTEEAWE